MCLQNLMRRKSRTFLTVLGVLIGCCSIVIMVSLGIGMKESQDKTAGGDGRPDHHHRQRPPGGPGQGQAGRRPGQAAAKALAGVEAVTPKQTLEVDSIRLMAGHRKPLCGGVDHRGGPGHRGHGADGLSAPGRRPACQAGRRGGRRASTWPTISRTPCARRA